MKGRIVLLPNVSSRLFAQTGSRSASFLTTLAGTDGGTTGSTTGIKFRNTILPFSSINHGPNGHHHLTTLWAQRRNYHPYPHVHTTQHHCFSTHAESDDGSAPIRMDVPSSGSPWMDLQRSLPARVEALMEVPKIHPKEIETIHSVLFKLVVECCKIRSFEGMQLVTQIMERILVEKERYRQVDNVDVIIPVKLWEKVLYGWVHMARHHSVSVDRMKGVMETVLEQAEKDELRCSREDLHPRGLSSYPDTSIYNTLLQGLAQASALSIETAALAEKTLQDMKDLHAKKGWHVKPNTRSYTLAIEAQTSSKDPRSGDRAAAIFERVKQEHKEQARVFREQRGVEYSRDLTESGSHGAIVQADATMYTVAMKAALHSNNSAKHVLTLLEEAIAAGVADLIHFEIAIRAMTRIIETTKNPLDRARQADRAERLLYQSMSYEEMPNASRVTLMNACLDAWSRSFVQEMGERAENLLNNMMKRDVTPDLVSFHCTMRCWLKLARLHGEKAVQRAESVLELHKKLAQESAVDFPDYQSYSMAILVHAGRGADSVGRAALWVEEMIVAARERRLTLRSRDNPCAPFAAFLSVLAQASPPSNETKSKEGTSADYIWGDDDTDLWGDDDRDLRLPKDPWDWASQIYDSVTQNTFRIPGLAADHHFYAAFLRNLVVHGNPNTVDFEDTALRVWDRACMEGQVSRLVLDQARKIPVLKARIPGTIPQFWRHQVNRRWR